jgi:hypothetical protein
MSGRVIFAACWGWDAPKQAVAKIATPRALGPRLTRHGYNAKALAELLDTKPAEIRSFLQGNLTPARTQELQNSLLAIGIPL